MKPKSLNLALHTGRLIRANRQKQGQSVEDAVTHLNQFMALHAYHGRCTVQEWRTMETYGKGLIDLPFLYFLLGSHYFDWEDIDAYLWDRLGQTAHGRRVRSNRSKSERKDNQKPETNAGIPQ